MYPDGVDRFDFEARTLEFVDHVSQRGAGVCAGEDVFVHEQAPDQVFVLPVFPQPGDLEVEDAVVVKQVVDLSKEAGEFAHADVLGHLQAGDFLVLGAWLVVGRGDGDVAIVHAEDSRLGVRNAAGKQAVVAPFSLISAECDARSVGAVVDARIFGQRAPATADVEQRLSRLQTNLLTYDGEFVVLQLLEGFLVVDVRDDARGIDHAGAEEPGVEIVAAVVVVADLFFVLRAGVHDDFGNHADEEEAEQREGEAEIGPVVAVFEGL